MRICSLLPSATEILYALGLGDQVVGVTHECDYPPAARGKPVVVRSGFDPAGMTSGEIEAAVRASLRDGHGLYTIEAEVLRRADPDLIVTQDLCDVCALPAQAVAAAIAALPRRPRVLALKPERLHEVLADIRTVGEAAGRGAEADRLVAELAGRIAAVGRLTARVAHRPRVLCLEWFDPLYVGGHWIPEMVNLAGGEDVAGVAGQRSRLVTWEEVRAKAPEVILVIPCGADTARIAQEMHLVERLPGWSEVPAVRSGRVYATDASSYFSRPGPRLADGLEILAHFLHPEIFPRPDLPEVGGPVHELARPQAPR
ncbi:MAG TPA: cobalamin-binding protein [Candidatus Methylomirabilis sp.]